MTDDEKTEQLRKEAFASLEDTIAKFADLQNQHNAVTDTGAEMAVDAVLLIGMQYLYDDGDRGGYVNIIPRGGWQPGYITAGLLSMAQARVVESHTCSGQDD
ncbi:hypothetical protein PBI_BUZZLYSEYEAR_104 [Mycobacterium phage BuzzLyseyear]|uniref:Uncharacterized protein n=1 Tax=Mycobacterium phage BuzzLyseyear TaxID=1536598 RepID=A0A088FUJ8_9CAUD|nr:hypothetical protein PBI_BUZZLYSEYEAR_104 [Mycobacterium phage BuzzLyseyear]AIM50226.1 hypothetical protein PBI_BUZZLYSEYEAR_104 [Mycobacterium phage BuzzLyseyear]